MKVRLGLFAAVLAHAGCGYPDYQFGNVGGGGGGAATGASSSASSSSSASAASSSSSAASSSSSTAASSSSGASCSIANVVISQIRTRGAAGAGDEFVELYNPTSAPVQLDASFVLKARGTGAVSYDTRWTGDGSTLQPHGHYLIAGSAYVQMPLPDGTLASGITDAGSIVLVQGGKNIDVVCFAYDTITSGLLGNFIDPFTCAGTPATNPHDDSNGTNADVSLERRPGGAFGNCTDTMNNAYDFIEQMPADPADLASPPAP